MTSAPVPATTRSGGGGGTRWCPTPEQVMLLEGMYRGGLRTPTSTQIQQITARLSIYGKIQGKNVFYWFQNHKARDRQKLRKRLMALYQQHRLYPTHDDHPFLPLDSVGGVEDASKCKPIINNWNQIDHDQFPSDQTCKLICDCPLMTTTTMMLMEHHGTTPYCTTRVPPKTLQLFPLKQHDHQSTTSSKP